MRYGKKANQVGIAIIVMALLLLLAGIFLGDNNSISKNSISQNKQNSINYPQDNYLFYLNETDIGRQKKVIENYPNIDLGSQIQYDTAYIGNSFRLNANPFTRNNHSINLQFDNPKDIEGFFIYFNPTRLSGEEDLIIKINNQIVSESLAKSSDIPIKVNLNLHNTSSVKMSFELIKPAWYDLFNWNKLDIENLKIVAIKQDKENNKRDFNFQIQKKFLERAYVNLAIKCSDIKKVSEPIKIIVNGYIISNENPKCTSTNTLISAPIPLNILKDDKNSLELQTNGFYKVGYSINKIYFNDQDVYKFTINNFNDIIDVIMHGDFDKDIIDLKINDQTMSLKRNEIKSIIQYLRLGTNKIEFLTKPLDIKEFVIEKNEFWN